MTGSRWTTAFAAVAVALLGALSSASAASADNGVHSLQFVSPSSLKLTTSGKTATATVTVRNNGAKVSNIRFLTVPNDGRVKVTSTRRSIGGFTVGNFALTLTPKNAEKSFKGTLIVFGKSGAARTGTDKGGASTTGVVPGTVPFELGPSKGPPSWLYYLIFAPLGFAALLVTVRWNAWKSKRREEHERLFHLGSRMGPANWDFSTSWASNLTVVGALLGTILSAGALPDETAVSKATYAGLNLLFGVLILVAPLVYTATRRPTYVHRRTAKAAEPQYLGVVFFFLVASALTLGAVLGELATVLQLFREIRTANSLPVAAVWLMGVLVVAAALLLVRYSGQTIGWILTDQCDIPRHRKKKHAELVASGSAFKEDGSVITEAEVEPELPSWSML